MSFWINILIEVSLRRNYHQLFQRINRYETEYHKSKSILLSITAPSIDHFSKPKKGKFSQPIHMFKSAIPDYRSLKRSSLDIPSVLKVVLQ